MCSDFLKYGEFGGSHSHRKNFYTAPQEQNGEVKRGYGSIGYCWMIKEMKVLHCDHIYQTLRCPEEIPEDSSFKEVTEKPVSKGVTKWAGLERCETRVDVLQALGVCNQRLTVACIGIAARSKPW